MVERLFYWKCDHCLAHVEKVSYGLPGGWMVHDRRTGLPIIKHYCKDCVDTLELNKKQTVIKYHECSTCNRIDIGVGIDNIPEGWSFSCGIDRSEGKKMCSLCKHMSQNKY